MQNVMKGASERNRVPYYGWQKLFFMMPIFLLFLSASVKSDLDSFAQSEFWSSLKVSTFTEIIKNNNYIIYLLMTLSYFYTIISIKKIYIFPLITTLSYILLYIYSSIVVASEEEAGLAIRFVVSAAMLAGIYVYIGVLAASGKNYLRYIKKGALAFAIFLIMLNVFEYALGNGIARSFPRFFGTSSHPNFIGVQMAVCGLCVWSVFEARNAYMTIAKIIVMFCAFLVMYLTGSRTSIAVFSSGLACIFIVEKRIATSLFILIAVALLGMIVLTFADLSFLADSDVYDRGSGLSRAEVWADLWHGIKQAPFMGHGYMPDFVENSLLRGWFVVGVMYPVVLLSVIGGCIFNMGSVFRTPELKEASLFCGIFAGLSVGSIFEGYLFDANSLPIFAWFLSLTIIGFVARIAKLRHMGSVRRSQAVPPVRRRFAENNRRTVV